MKMIYAQHNIKYRSINLILPTKYFECGSYYEYNFFVSYDGCFYNIKCNNNM